MPTLLYSNNAAGTLASPITNSQTTLTLNAGQASLFPNPISGQAFYVTITDASTQSLIEIVQVTGVAGNIFTIVRGQDGTSGLSWNAGDIVSQRVIALELRSFTQGQLLAVQSFTTSGTYTPTSGANRAIVQAIGGGGAGGSIPATTSLSVALGLGGDAGAYGVLYVSSGLTSQTITIGPAGAPGAAGNNFGGNGGATSFGTLMSCSGGAGGSGGGPAGPPFIIQVGGTGASVSGTGNIVTQSTGAIGPCAIAISTGTNGFVAGKGADSPLGQGGLGGQGGNGFSANGFGAGGGGAGMWNSVSGFQGGSGAPGYLVVFEYQ